MESLHQRWGGLAPGTCPGADRVCGVWRRTASRFHSLGETEITDSFSLVDSFPSSASSGLCDDISYATVLGNMSCSKTHKASSLFSRLYSFFMHKHFIPPFRQKRQICLSIWLEAWREDAVVIFCLPAVHLRLNEAHRLLFVSWFNKYEIKLKQEDTKIQSADTTYDQCFCERKENLQGD